MFYYSYGPLLVIFNGVPVDITCFSLPYWSQGNSSSSSGPSVEAHSSKWCIWLRKRSSCRRCGEDKTLLMLLLNVIPVSFTLAVFINSATADNASTYTAAAVDKVRAASGWCGFVSSEEYRLSAVYREGENMESSVSCLLLNPFFPSNSCEVWVSRPPLWNVPVCLLVCSPNDHHWYELHTVGNFRQGSDNTHILLPVWTCKINASK